MIFVLFFVFTTFVILVWIIDYRNYIKTECSDYRDDIKTECSDYAASYVITVFYLLGLLVYNFVSDKEEYCKTNKPDIYYCEYCFRNEKDIEFCQSKIN